MAFDRMTDDMNIISKLPDEPNDEGGMTASALKATFDKAGTLAKTAINKLIAALGASTAAGNIGFAPTGGVNKTNIQAAIENVQSQIAGVALNTVPNGSIDTAQLANKSVTQHKLNKVELMGLQWEVETSDTLGYIRVTSWPFVRTGHLMPIKWYGGDRTFTRGDSVYVKDATGDVVAEIDIPSTGTTQYFNLKSTANYMILCTDDEDGYNIPPSFTFLDLPTWSDSPEGAEA